MVKICNKNLKLNCFTHYNVVSLLICIYYKNLYNLYAITTCWSWSIFFTFNSSLIFDKTTSLKIRKKMNCSFLEFHIGNFILHVVPIFYIYKYPPPIINFYHFYISLFIKYLWVYISTNKTMDLSNIYISFTPTNVKKLYLTSTITSLLVPCYYKLF